MNPKFLKKIIIVCTGNICRSPMAAAFFKKKAIERGQEVLVSSAGLSAPVGAAADIVSIALMKSAGIDISNHKAKQFGEEDVIYHDLILVMNDSQKKFIELTYPIARGKVLKLGLWNGIDIPDPHGKASEVYKKCVEMINQSILLWDGVLWSNDK